MEGAREPGGLNIDGLDNPECVTCTSDKLESTGSEPVCVLAGAGGIVVDEIPLLLNPIGGLVRKCLCMLNLRVNLRTSIKFVKGFGRNKFESSVKDRFLCLRQSGRTQIKDTFSFYVLFLLGLCPPPPSGPSFLSVYPRCPSMVL